MNSHIEFFQTGEYRAYTEDSKAYSELKQIEGIRPLGKYWHSNRSNGFDFIFPIASYRSVAKLLNLPLKKVKGL